MKKIVFERLTLERLTAKEVNEINGGAEPDPVFCAPPLDPTHMCDP